MLESINMCFLYWWIFNGYSTLTVDEGKNRFSANRSVALYFFSVLQYFYSVYRIINASQFTKQPSLGTLRQMLKLVCGWQELSTLVQMTEDKEICHRQNFKRLPFNLTKKGWFHLQPFFTYSSSETINIKNTFSTYWWILTCNSTKTVTNSNMPFTPKDFPSIKLFLCAKARHLI